MDDEDEGERTRFPTISTTHDEPSFSAHSDRKDLRTLPPIQSRSTKSDLVLPETPVVIGTRTMNRSSDNLRFERDKGMCNWQEQELQSKDEIQKTKLGWENDIARHILSLYATTNALKNLKESQSLLDFVGEKEPENYVPFHDDNAKKKDADDDLDFLKDPRIDESNPQSKRKTGKKPRRRKLMRTNSEVKRVRHHMSKIEQDEQNKKFIDEVIQKLENSMSLSKEKDHYRVSNTIKTKGGAEIEVRGSPRCFPIWFVSSGDVYVDWTGLVGGKQLQSHLSVLYENHYYEEYVNILETLLLSYWREKCFGKEEFSLGNFGKSESGANTPYSGQKQRSRSSSKQGTRGFASSRPLSSTLNPEQALSPHVTGGEDLHGNRPRVSFYENLLNKEINPSLRPEIEEKVAAFNLQDRQEQRLPSSSLPLSHSNFNSVQDLTLSRLTLADIENYWKQLVLTTLAIGILCIERKNYDKGMKFFIRADDFSKNDDLIPSAIERKEYRAHVKDAMAFYFFKRGKFIAALAYSSQALEVFEQRGRNLEGIGACLLHMAATYSQMSKFKESHKLLFQFLAMVENGRLALQEATPKQLCLVAVGYHNLAVIQLKLAMPDLACKSSQNARKIARLCLAYSNRWINIFQYTHEVAVSDMKYELQSKSMDEISPQQMLLIKQLAEALFSIDSQA